MGYAVRILNTLWPIRCSYDDQAIETNLSKEIKMKFAEVIIDNLLEQLKEFGLNPSDWKVKSATLNGEKNNTVFLSNKEMPAFVIQGHFDAQLKRELTQIKWGHLNGFIY